MVGDELKERLKCNHTFCYRQKDALTIDLYYRSKAKGLGQGLQRYVKQLILTGAACFCTILLNIFLLT